MKSFDFLWSLLSPSPEYNGLRTKCEQLWSSFNIQKQRLIYKVIQTKQRNGEFVDFNPYYALQKNANPQPHFLNGWEMEDAWSRDIPIVRVKYNELFLICTRETMEDFGLLFVSDVPPYPKPKKTPEEDLVAVTFDRNLFFVV